jgi:phage tail sheath protein FI
MALDYNSPGIYVEEVDTGPRPISAVGTSTAGFLGVAPDAGAEVGKAIAVNNWSEFCRRFARDSTTSTDLSNAVYGFFLNGGSRCYVVNIGTGGTVAGNKGGLQALEAIDEIAIIAAPGYTDPGSHGALLASAELLKDRIAVLDGPKKVDDTAALIAYALDTPASADAGEGKAPKPKPTAAYRPALSSWGAFYYPWIVARDPFAPKQTVDVPPSGHMAGIYARTDAERGVHKAPANIVVRGATSLTAFVTAQDQQTLNPAGVNCIRFFSREGILVWGARTLERESSNWRYLSVRRLFAMIEESIGIGTRWVVFEPNDIVLWKALKRDVGAFLTLLWRQGAFAGSTPEEAFFVKCDEETNPSESINEGRVVVIVGIAPVKPAEFVIFRIGQTDSGTTVEAA